MLKVYVSQNSKLSEIDTKDDILKIDNAVWIDVRNPTKNEKKNLEKTYKISIPDAVEIDDIEVSKRLYNEKKTHYLTMYTFSRKGNSFKLISLRFILLKKTLITIRYGDDAENDHMQIENFKTSDDKKDHEKVLFGLLKLAIYNIADILEQIGSAIDRDNSEVLNSNNIAIKNDFKKVLQNIAKNGDLTSRTRECIISVSRVSGYVMQDQGFFSDDLKNKMLILSNDIEALNDHTFFLSNQINFLLEATLGMINIDQNISIRIFSLASMIFLPPTLVASIYGMNFSYIPGMAHQYGFIISVVVMLLSAIIPYKYFKKKGWF